MRVKAVLFDFDYTLGDSTEGIVTCIQYALHRLGKEPAFRQDIIKTIGYRLQDAYRMLVKEGSTQESEQFKSYFMEKADEVMARDTRLYDGVLCLLMEMRKQGIKLGIVTTKYKFRIQEILKKYQAETYVDVIIGGDSVTKEKPEPEGVNLACELLQVKKEEVLYVGDSLVDAKTAMAAKVPFVAVTTGTTEREDFQTYPYYTILSHVTEIDREFLEKTSSHD